MNDRPLDLALTRLEQSVAALAVGQAAHWRDMRRAVDDLTGRVEALDASIQAMDGRLTSAIRELSGTMRTGIRLDDHRPYFG
jgi:hypothetical protein